MPVLSTLKLLFKVFANYRLHVAALAGLGFLSAIVEGIGINAAIPLLSFLTGGSGVPQDPISRGIAVLFGFLHIPFAFRYLLIFIISLFFLRAVFMVLFGFTRGYIAADFMAAESRGILHRLMHARWRFLLRQKLGTVQNTAVRDVQRTRDLLNIQVQFIQSVTGLLMYLLVAFNISPLMTALTLAGGGALMLVIRPLLLRTNRVGEAVSSTEKEVAQFLGEHIIGMKTLKASGREDRAVASGQNFINRLRTLAIRMAKIQSVSAGLFQPFSVIFVVILFAITYQSPAFSLISFAATLYLIQKIFTYLDSAQSSLHSIFELLPYARSILVFKEALDHEREPDVREDADFNFTGALEFENVSLSYGSGRPVLNGVSFSLARGQRVGLIGPSGAGKTSLADLILRLFEPTSGRILVDGKPAGDIPLSGWRHAIGYVSQDVFLLNDTIEENIRFYRGGVSTAEIETAARQANIHDFIMSLPEGYQTRTGDRGVLLSGGQRQRVALARALLGRPKLLVLDEATSALDNESERLIQEAIRSLHGSVTVFMIAHRLSTTESADWVLVLEDGTITGQGSPAELAADPASYLSRMQDL